MIMLKGFKTVAAVSLAALSIGVASTVTVDSASARSVPSYQQYDINSFTWAKTYYSWHYTTYRGGSAHDYNRWVSSGWNYDRWEYGYNYY